MREDRVRVYLCCVSCHLCVRAHHRNCEACAHTSTIALLSAGHQHSHIHMSPTSLVLSDLHTFGHILPDTCTHTVARDCFQSTASVHMHFGIPRPLLVEKSVSLHFLQQMCRLNIFISERLKPKPNIYRWYLNVLKRHELHWNYPSESEAICVWPLILENKTHD